MIYTQHALSIRQQSTLLEVNRNRLKPERAKISEEDHKIMLHLEVDSFTFKPKVLHILLASLPPSVNNQTVSNKDSNNDLSIFIL